MIAYLDVQSSRQVLYIYAKQSQIYLSSVHIIKVCVASDPIQGQRLRGVKNGPLQHFRWRSGDAYDPTFLKYLVKYKFLQYSPLCCVYNVYSSKVAIYYVGISYYLVLFVQTLKTLKWNQSKTQRLKRTFYRPVPPKKFKIFCPPPNPGPSLRLWSNWNKNVYIM